MLTPDEKVAGRLFRDTAQANLDAINSQDPPTYVIPTVINIFRHNCPKRAGRSTALECKEMYLPSPGFLVTVEGEARVQEEQPTVPEGRFAFLYRQGVCRVCGHTARSAAGRLVGGWERPPGVRTRVLRRISDAGKEDAGRSPRGDLGSQRDPEGPVG